MHTLSEDAIATLIAPYLVSASEAQVSENLSRKSATRRSASELVPLLQTYLDLLLFWNARTNLTAIRSPEEIVQRHLGESLFTGDVVAQGMVDGSTLLDYGSGAGFPGLPIHLLLPKIRVTLAESQGKKAAFLREAVRVLKTDSEVWSGRVEAMPADRCFDVVTLRAVDDMSRALGKAGSRVATGGRLIGVTTERGAVAGRRVSIPRSQHGVLWIQENE